MASEETSSERLIKTWRLARSTERFKKKKKNSGTSYVDDQKHMKRCSISLLIKEMKMKAANEASLLIQVRTAIIKKMYKLNLKGCREKGILVHCSWECKLVQSL